MRNFLLTAILASTPLLSGCVERVVYERPPEPAPRAEVVTVAPYAKAVWVPGHWRWHRRGYVWISGRWR